MKKLMFLSTLIRFFDSHQDLQSRAPKYILHSPILAHLLTLLVDQRINLWTVALLSEGVIVNNLPMGLSFQMARLVFPMESS